MSFAEVKASDVDVVELVGGSCRIPIVRQTVKEMFGGVKDRSSTMNMDEAVARGCAMQCAILSPKFRVREFSVTDVQPFRVKLTWDAVGGSEGGSVTASSSFLRCFSLRRRRCLHFAENKTSSRRTISFPSPRS